MRIPTLDDFRRDQGDLDTDDDSGKEKGETRIKSRIQDRYRKWLSRKKDRQLAAQEAMRKGSSVTGQYGNSMQYGSTF